MEDKRYDALILGKIRKWWDLKSADEKRGIIIDTTNTIIGLSLIFGSAAVTARAVKMAYDLKEAKKKALDDMYCRSDNLFNVNSENNKSEILVVRQNPETGHSEPEIMLTGDIEAFNKTAKRFSDAAAYIKAKSADNQYAKVVYSVDKHMKKYKKPM